MEGFDSTIEPFITVGLLPESCNAVLGQYQKMTGAFWDLNPPTKSTPPLLTFVGFYLFLLMRTGEGLRERSRKKWRQ